MDKKTIAALIAGAEKWERNALAKETDDARIYGNSCELCEMFAAGSSCSGCPVYEKTGADECSGTPWVKAHVELINWQNEEGTRRERNARARFRRAASAEAKFLRSLIPAEGATA